MDVLLFLFSLFYFSLGDIDYGTQRCVDQTGIIRSEGETWIADGCRQCSCTNGNVVCQKLHIRCYPRPHPHCIEIPGPCCPQWDCSTTGPDCSAVFCPGPPQDGCRPIIPPGECCAVDWVCPDCSLVFCPIPPRKDCQPIVPPGECCPIDYVCPDCSTVRCAGPPQPHCQPIFHGGECCPIKWDCGCNDFQGMIRKQGEVWKDPVTPCTVCSCHDRIVECFTENCNTGCTDHQGAPRNEKETWQDPIDPCTFCSCENGIVSCFVRDCPPPPHIPCTRPPHPGQCCLDCNPSLTYYH
ncbi:uncharacterized protein [Panulirus ornatus]|uniref:uncharacterized protein n=1 Tax=Panulirus ornatus TaxID=150431 RepID=UPI003A865414